MQERRMAARNRPPGSGEVAGEGAGRRGGQVAKYLGGKGTAQAGEGWRIGIRLQRFCLVARAKL